MRQRRLTRDFAPLLVAGLTVMVAGVVATVLPSPRIQSQVFASRQAALKAPSRLPLVFEPNRGQAESGVAFVSRGPGYVLELSATQSRLRLAPGASSRRPAELEMRLAGAATGSVAVGDNDRGGRSHYILGTDRANDILDVPQFGRVIARDVYPRVDVVYHGQGARIEYDFVVAPGGDPASIALRFTGQRDLRLTPDGALAFRLGDSELRHEQPILYQLPGRDAVEGRFVLEDDGTVGFDVPRWDRSRTLVVDPVLVFSTYLGGSGTFLGGAANDRANAVAVDSSGNIYLTGTTGSVNFPTVGPAQATNGGSLSDGSATNTDAFVTKLNSAGTAIVYSTYLGGAGLGGDKGLAIAVATDGSAVVGGEAQTGFPTTSSPLNSCGGGSGFVTKLTPAGNALSYSICFSGGSTRVNGLALDSSANAYITGLTNGGDAMVRKLNATGTAWGYTVSLAGSNSDEGFGISVDSIGNACVAGATSSTNLPVMNALQPAKPGPISSAFAAKYSAAGTPVFVTYLGGAFNELGYGAAIDAAGNCYVAGVTGSANFPLTNAAVPSLRGNNDGFVTAYNANGSAYLYSTYLGGSATDVAYDVAVSAAGIASVVGKTSSENFPVMNALQPGLKDIGTAYVSQNTGGAFTRLGLSNVSVQALAVDPTNAQVIYAGTAAGVYKTSDGGTSWARVDSGLTYTDVRSLAIDPNNACRVYAGIETNAFNLIATRAALVRSLDCGSSWGFALAGSYGTAVESLAFTNSSPSTLYFSMFTNDVPGGSHGVGRTTSTGEEVSYQPGYYYLKVGVDPASPCTAYFGDFYGNVRRNTSCSAWNWSSFGALASNRVNTIVPHPSNQSSVLVGAAGGVYRRADSASAWTLALNTFPHSIRAIGFQPGNPQVAYAAGSGGVLYKSTDGGATWAASATIGPAVSSFAVTPSLPSLVAAGTFGDTDAFYTQLSAAGAIVASTWLGGFGTDTAYGVALTPSGDAIVVGHTLANTFPTTDGVPYPNAPGSGDAFIARIDPVSAPPNTPPTISDVADRSVAQGGSTGPIAFTVGDAETSSGSLTLSATSSNAVLVPAGNIVFGGGGATRTVTVTPAAGQFGTSTITLTVSDGTSTASDSFVLTVPVGPVSVQPPSGLTVESSVGNTVSLRWGVPASGPTPTGYVVEGGVNPGQILGSLPTAGPATTLTFTAPTGAFYLRVHALDGATRSSASNEVRVSVNVPVPPSAPANLLGLVVGNTVSLAWTPTFSGGTATATLLTVTGAVNASMPLGLSDTFTFAGMPPGTYTFAVAVSNAAGASAPSNAVTLTFPGGCTGAPQVPANFSVSNTGGTANLSWDPPVVGAAPTGYVVTVSGAFVGAFPVASRGLSAAAPSGTYNLSLTATNPCGSGPPTAVRTLVMP